MTPDQVLDYYGSQSEIAKCFRLTRQSVNLWFIEGEIPDQRQWQIELALGGTLKADRPPAVDK